MAKKKKKEKKQVSVDTTVTVVIALVSRAPITKCHDLNDLK